MKYIQLFSLLSLQCCLTLGKSEAILIIALPQSDTEVEEILPGALTAIEKAKNSSPSFNLTLIRASSGPVTSLRYDLPYSGNVLEIIANLTWQKRASDIIGIAGVLHPNIRAILNRFQLSTTSLVHFNKPPHNSNINYPIAFMATSTLTDSILAFFNEISPRKIGLVTEIKEPYYLMVSNELSTKANISLDIHIVNKRQSLSNIIEKINVSNVHVILLSVGPSTALSVLCEAYKIGLTWPKYAWILHSYRLEDLLQISGSNEECSAKKILEGIFTFQLTKNLNSETKMGNDGFNPYARLLYDSVMALISSVDNKSLAHSSAFHFNPDSSKVYIHHNMNGTASLIQIFDGTSRNLTKLSEITFTDPDLPRVNKELLSPYLLPLPILCFLLNTILLILYILFRNQPSVKSTSVSLSMLMFTGCYLLITFTVGFLLFDKYSFDLCVPLVWLSDLGLPLSLIYAILLVKMLRVYHIFTTFKVLKQSAKCKDYALLVYTVLILLPQIAVLILWSAISPTRRMDNITEYPGFIEIEGTCDHDNDWQSLFTIAYQLLLEAIIIFVIIKSRKIRRAHFNDTMKVTLLILLLYLIGICAHILYYIFSDMSFSTKATVTYIVNILTAFLCQITLFVPKIWPLVQKKTLQRFKALQKCCHFYLLAHYHNVSQNNSTQLNC